MLTVPPADNAAAPREGTLGSMNAKFRVAALSLALIVLAGLVLLLVRPGLNPARIRPMPLLIGAWLAFIAAAWLLRKVSLRVSVAAILLGGIAVQLVAVSAPSQNSTDLYRYVWDGRVQAAGIDPYEYVPAASQLTRLRDPFLWPAHGQDCLTATTPPAPGTPRTAVAPGCTLINRANVPTI